MHQFTLFILLSPLAMVSATLVAINAWQQRKNPAAVSFLAFTILAIGWILSYTFELLSVSDEATFFWSRFGYLFIATTPIALFVFVARYIGFERLARPWYIIGVLVVPIMTNAMIWNVTMHRLIWSSYHIVHHDQFSLNAIDNYGPWFWISNAINYALVFASMLLLVRYALRSSILFRRQTTWILLGASFPIATNLLYIFRVIPNLVMDFTPLSFAVLGVFMALGIFREKLFDLSPLVRETLLDHIDDGLLLLDERDRVLDVNPAAARIFNIDRRMVLGTPVTDLLSNWPELSKRIGDEVTQHTIMLQQESQQCCHYDLKISLLRSRSGKLVATILLMRDVTERIHLLEELQQLATHDPLTDLYNRRYFFQLANQVLSQTIRYQRDASVLIIDIDHFKRFNDDFGHATGDMVLRNFANTCRETLRASDILARYGGEEFVIFLPETAKENAVCVGDRLRAELAKSPVLTDLKERYITISVGVASYQPDMVDTSLDILLDRADQALYQAKQAGRDRVVSWEEGYHNPHHTGP